MHIDLTEEYTPDKARSLIAEGSLEDALLYTKHWLSQDPHQPEALQLCGLIHAKRNELTHAYDCFMKILKLDPDHASAHLNLSNILITMNHFEQAQNHLFHALRLRPLHAETYNNLGRLYYKQGRIPESITTFQKALRLDPNCWEAHYNLAHSYTQQNQMIQAVNHYSEVVRLHPEHTIAHFNLGLASFECGDLMLAEKHLVIALQQDHSLVEAARQLGHIYLALGKTNEAIASFTQALEHDPHLEDPHHNLGILYLNDQQYSKALFHFEKALSLNPHNQTAKHMINALKGDQHCTTASLEYVKQLFDQYAEYYNDHLKKTLHYDVPGQLRSAVGSCLGPNPKAGRVLDLGCGTGLCGVTFRDLALELVGIDLSSQMIEKAKLLDTYEKLLTSDFNTYFNQTETEPFDIIVAGDVFVYTGALEQLFSQISQKLKPQGLFAFTVETLDDLSQDYHLNPTGRFSHSLSYIDKLGSTPSNHLKKRIGKEIPLREHHGQRTKGRLYVFVKC